MLSPYEWFLIDEVVCPGLLSGTRECECSRCHGIFIIDANNGVMARCPYCGEDCEEQ